MELESDELFRISKISTFESNSQPLLGGMYQSFCCSEYQRYQLLRAIHNTQIETEFSTKLFRISKISTFESNSQQNGRGPVNGCRCSEYRKHPIKYPLIYFSLTLAFIISAQRFQTLPVIVRVLLEYY